MDITKLPFNAFIGLETCSSDETGILTLPKRDEYSNHVGTVHASALFALAEASSGSHLQRNFSRDGSGVLAMLRASEIKYRKPAAGQIHSTGRIDDESRDSCIKTLKKKGKVRVSIEIDLWDELEMLVATARFDWFLSIET